MFYNGLGLSIAVNYQTWVHCTDSKLSQLAHNLLCPITWGKVIQITLLDHAICWWGETSCFNQQACDLRVYCIFCVVAHWKVWNVLSHRELVSCAFIRNVRGIKAGPWLARICGRTTRSTNIICTLDINVPVLTLTVIWLIHIILLAIPLIIWQTIS